MTDAPHTAALEPSLALVLRPGALSCAGALNRWNRDRLLDAVRLLVESGASSVVIDISGLHIEDVDGANALARAQRAVRDAGATLSWHGLGSDRLKGILPLQGATRCRRTGRVARPLPRRHPATMPPSA